jgi:manganese efflux pump family protein
LNVVRAVLLSFALAMDATAVALTRGLIGARREVLLVPLLFGGFQAGMAGLGLAVGNAGQGVLGNAKLWIAAALLLILGVRMAMGGLKGDDDSDAASSSALAAADAATPSLFMLVSLAFATSIDAAAAGATLPALPVSPALSLALIGIITMVCSAAAILAGRKLRARAGDADGKWFEVAGGLVLIGLAVKTAIDAATM